MLNELSKELDKFVNDMKKILKNPEDVEYFTKRVDNLFDVIMKFFDDIMKYNEKELNRLEEKQKLADERLEEISKKLKEMYRDIYEEDGENFEIVCPYCNCEFDADIDESRTEVICPECNNSIELDWGGDNDDYKTDCNGGCSNCNGCEE